MAPSSSSYGNYDTVMETLATALAKGSYLLGEHFTAADVVIGSGLRWGGMMKAVPERAALLIVGDIDQQPVDALGVDRTVAGGSPLALEERGDPPVVDA